MKSEIILKNVYLDFPLYDAQVVSLRNKITSIGNKYFSKIKKNTSGIKVIEGLKDFSYNFQYGDKVGIIGSNGSGKTTLLKLLAGIYSPTSGCIEKKGELSCMLDLGFGFEHDATGYENILLSNITRGLAKKEIDKILPEIVEFCGLGEFLNMPFRTYSSGMQARLAFASVIATTPDILLIDEFFSTGDREFSQKSRSKILELMNKSSILIFASHSMDLIEDICNKAILIKNGEIAFAGNPKETISFYKKG